MKFFWHDNWETVIRGAKAVGHFIEFCDINGNWLAAEIIHYDDSNKLHTIKLDAIEERTQEPRCTTIVQMTGSVLLSGLATRAVY